MPNGDPDRGRYTGPASCADSYRETGTEYANSLASSSAQTGLSYTINSTGKRHNSRCRYLRQRPAGRAKRRHSMQDLRRLTLVVICLGPGGREFRSSPRPSRLRLGI